LAAKRVLLSQTRVEAKNFRFFVALLFRMTQRWVSSDSIPTPISPW
jgi:hypothetical protein